jgi:predicted site-specific integrase-resolvase
MEMMTTKEAAEFLGFSEGTLENWRLQNKPPVYYKVSGKVVYDKADLIAWVKEGKIDNA